MTRKEKPISVRRYLNRSSDWRKGFISTQFSFFRNALLSFLKKTKYSVFSFDFNNNEILLFFLKIGYLTCFFIFFTFSYSRIFPKIEDENYTRAFQVFLQLSLFLFHFRRFTTKEEKEGKWLLLLSVFYSVVATLFLKNLVSLEVLLFFVVPVFCFCLVRLPSDVLPFASLLFYSLERELAEWGFYLLFQLVVYFGLCFFLEDRPKKSISPFIIPLIFFWIIGKIHYSADFLHESARLTAMVSGACIIFLCFRRRKQIAFLSAFSLYFVLSTRLGVISIASAPGGDNISCPIPFLFILCHVILFLGLFLFQRNIRAERQPLVPLLFGALLFFLPYFPTLGWLEGWIEGLDFFLLLLGILLFVCGEENE